MKRFYDDDGITPGFNEEFYDSRVQEMLAEWIATGYSEYDFKQMLSHVASIAMYDYTIRKALGE